MLMVFTYIELTSEKTGKVYRWDCYADEHSFGFIYNFNTSGGDYHCPGFEKPDRKRPFRSFWNGHLSRGPYKRSLEGAKVVIEEAAKKLKQTK